MTRLLVLSCHASSSEALALSLLDTALGSLYTVFPRLLLVRPPGRGYV